MDVNPHGAPAAAHEVRFVLNPVIHPRVVVVKMCSGLQSLELTGWIFKGKPFYFEPCPFSFGYFSLFPQLHLVLIAYRAAGLKNQK